jgi:hypothetical protein
MMSLTTPENCQAGDTRWSAMRQSERKALAGRKLGVDKSVECVAQPLRSLHTQLQRVYFALLEQAVQRGFSARRQLGPTSR